MNLLFLLIMILFVLCAALLVHNYVVYPLLMRRVVRGRRLPDERFLEDDELPEVGVLMSAYNEESVLDRTVRSILASDYPAGKLRLWIGSDGSTDRTHEIVEQIQKDHPELHLTIFGGRNGKIRIINALVEPARQMFERPEKALFVLCDANVRWSPHALRRLASHFKRGDVGLVAPVVQDSQREHEGIGDEEEAYVGLENAVKFAEGVLWGKMMGAFGACYAIRASEFVPVPEHFIVDDYFQTMSVLERGEKAIVEPAAVCYESVSTDISEEFRRKRRIACGNFQNMRRFWSYYLPWNGGLDAAFAFWSHKGLRWVGPILLLGLVASTAALATMHPFFLMVFAGILASLAAAAIDRWLESRAPKLHWKPLRFLRYFWVMNAALFLGLLDHLSGEKNSVWEPTKRVGTGLDTARAGSRPVPR